MSRRMRAYRVHPMSGELRLYPQVMLVDGTPADLEITTLPESPGDMATTTTEEVLLMGMRLTMQFESLDALQEWVAVPGNAESLE